jgi:peptidyl-tRNA hydrolase, PTH1 family
MKWLWSWRNAKGVENAQLVIGLGNPGAHYATTRHNLGAQALRAYAQQQGWSWKRQRKLLVERAVGERLGRELHLVVPMTYMNESGKAVGRLVRHDKWPLERLLVLVDDVDLPLGKMRLRPSGSSTHNGLRSLCEYLGTDQFARLRMGIGRDHGDLAEFVLDPFAPEEQGQVSQMESRAAQVIDAWLTGSLERAMEEAQK